MTLQDNDDIGEDDLHAYVDGHLPAERHRLVEQWLKDNAEAAATVATWQAQTVALREIFQPIADSNDPYIDQQARNTAQFQDQGDLLNDPLAFEDHFDAQDGRQNANGEPHGRENRSEHGERRRSPHREHLTQNLRTAMRPRRLVPPAPGFYDDGFGERASPSAAARSGPTGRRGSYPLRQMVAAAMVFIAGGIGGAAIMEASIPKQPLARDYVQTLPEASSAGYGIYASEIRHPVEVYADQKDHLVGWLGKRLGMSFSAPDLTAQGFTLVGGRLLPFAGKPGALLMYQDSRGQRLTMMVGHDRDSRITGFRYQTSGNIETFYWIDGPMGYAVSGEIGKALLEDVAVTIYQQLNT